MAWSFNSGLLYSLLAVHPYNGGMVGLASSGNAINVVVDPVEPREVEFSPPGSNWTARRVAGLPMRRVLWRWQMVGASEAGLNGVETVLEQYLADGREALLSDGTRSSSYAVMKAARRLGPRRKLPDGRYLQGWQIEFMVTRPVVGSTNF